jgi:hypothetical protein
MITLTIVLPSNCYFELHNLLNMVGLFHAMLVQPSWYISEGYQALKVLILS